MGILVWIEVAIGMALVYALFALVLTAACEMLAGLLDSRGRLLQKAIGGLFTGADGGKDSGAQKEFFDHPLIATVSRPTWLRLKALGYPSYLSAETFLAATIDTFRKTRNEAVWTTAAVREAIDGLPDSSPIKTIFRNFWLACDEDVGRFRQQIEKWYSGFEDVMRGWYRQNTQVILLVLGLLVAAVCNVDSIALMRQISSDAGLRTALVQQAAAEIQRSTEGGKEDQNDKLNQAIRTLEASRLDLGWNDASAGRFVGSLKSMGGDSEKADWHWLWKLLGIVVSALAMTLGAPFWFEMLKRLFEVRSVGMNFAERLAKRLSK